MSDKTEVKLRQRKLERELTLGFMNYICSRFNVMPTAERINIDLGMRETAQGLEWKFRETEYVAAFYMNGNGQPKFLIRMNYDKKKGLGKSISNSLHSKREIDKKSRYIGRTVRICNDDSYMAVCKLKNPKQEPRKNLYDQIFGYLMARPLMNIYPRLA